MTPCIGHTHAGYKLLWHWWPWRLAGTGFNSEMIRKLNLIRASQAPLYHLQLPFSFPENVNADERQQDLGHQDRVIGAVRADLEFHAQNECQRQLHDPVHKKVDPRWRPCIARSVEGLHNHLTIGPQDVTATDDSQAACAVTDHLRVAAEHSDQLRRKDEETHRHYRQKNSVEETGAPD